MPVLRPWSSEAELAVPLLGGGLTLLAAYLSVQVGPEVGAGVLLLVAVFIGAVIGFVAYPHVAVAATIVLFALIPALKVFVWADFGGLKDLVVIAAASAALLVHLFERRRADGLVAGLVLLLGAVYAINVGGAHDVAWLHGMRLVGEPLALLLVGLLLSQPRRTLRWALAALIATAGLVAAYGIVQQLAGEARLLAWGYAFESELRVLEDGRLRSFGTLDDPFSYAALLLFGIAGVMLWLRHGPAAWAAGLLILAGLAVSFVRTAFLVLVGLAALALIRRRRGAAAALMVVVALGGSAMVLAGNGETGSEASSGGALASANEVLNGRISAWSAALGEEPGDWLVGRGVGEVGTAADRATFTVASAGELPRVWNRQAVDSGYLATTADVGLVGLVVLLALYSRLLWLAVRAARQRMTAGWVALGLLVVLLLDTLTRDSFTGFPTAYVALLVVGIALAAAREEPSRPAAFGAP